jgi:hypothetical protein
MVNVEQNDPPRKDLSRTTKDTLAKYLGQKTAQNYFPVDGGTGWTSTSITSETPGLTPPIPSPNEPTKNSNWFTKGTYSTDGTSNVSEPLRGWKPRQKFEPPETSIGSRSDQLDLKKGKDPAGDPDLDGNDLLSKNESLEKIERYSNAVLKNNRFTRENKYVDFDVSDSSSNVRSEPVVYHPEYGPFTIDKLAQIAPTLLLRASDSEIEKLPGQERFPGEEKLVLKKIELVKLEARDAIESLSDAEASSADFFSIADGSWGTFTNFETQFDGSSLSAMEALAIVLTKGIFKIMDSLLDLVITTNKSFNPNEEPDRLGLQLGKSFATAQISGDPSTLEFWDILYYLTGLFGIVPTRNSYTLCVFQGLKALFESNNTDSNLFGIELPSILSATAGERGFSQATPGYISTLARAILRANLIFYDTFAKIPKNDMIMGTISVISNSKILKILNAIAAIGDGIISSYDYKAKLSSLSETSSMFDATPRQFKSNGRSIPYAAGAAPSYYLLPSSILQLKIDNPNLGGDLPISSMTDRIKILESGARMFKTNRSDPEQVSKIENILEAAYVPFYFHDLRTNEIISFHAFLDSITDGFSAEYESVSGFGRIDPVQIYKGTQRRMGLSFYVAALDDADFDEMWTKINKLVTLVYPQYTEGRVLAKGGYNFVQPFSQMVGASPLIRLRLGNLFRSNYSKFALARVFGAGLSGKSFQDTSPAAPSQASPAPAQAPPPAANSSPATDSESIQDPLEQEIFELAVERKTAFTFKNLDVLKQKLYPLLTNGLSAFSGLTEDDVQRLQFSIINHNKDASSAEIMWQSWNYGLDTISIFNFKERLTNEYGSAGSYPIFFEKISDFKIVDREPLVRQILANRQKTAPGVGTPVPATSSAPVGAVSPSSGSLESTNVNQNADPENLSSIEKFMQSSQNSVVKSFESAGGRGLAGVITNLDFDWYDKVTWDTRDGRKAPMMCKVTIGFTPIHDISPGIDSLGYNRAPVYPGGKK